MMFVALALWAMTAQPAGRDFPGPAGPKAVATIVLPDTLDLSKWKTTGPGRLSGSDKNAPKTERKALRIEVPQTREALKARSFMGQIFALPGPQDWSAYNRLVLWVYVEPSPTPRGASLSVHLYNDDEVRRTTGIYVVARGDWREVTWDLSPMPRSSVRRFMLTEGIHDHNPGESDRNVYHLGRMELRRVEPPTKYRGWELPPDRVAFSHVGYTPAGEKTAIFSAKAGPGVRLLDAATGRAVWNGTLRPATHTGTGRFQVADFSAWRQPGRYVLAADSPSGPVATEPFAVAAEVYQQAVGLVLDFYRAERCGDEAPGFHRPCHLDDGLVAPYPGMPPERFAPEVRALFGKHVDCSGGWHDAGDMAKFPHQEYDSAYQMLRLYDRGLRRPRPGVQRDGVLDEALWGVQYAMRTLLPTGRNCDRPERVGEGVWTDGRPGNEDDRHVGVTTWQSVERYIAGMMVEALAGRVIRPIDPALADRCLRQARLEAEAYLTGAMKDWREHPSPPKYASVGLAFLELFRATGDDRYREEAVRCGNELAACQEQSLAWNELGVTGFWYEGPQRRHPFAGGCGDGLHAWLLAELCRAFPDHSSWMTWYAALRIYARFYCQSSAEYLAPYAVPAFSLHDGPKQPAQWWDMVTPLGGQKSQRLDFQFDRLARIGPRYLVRIRNTASALPANAAVLAAIADLAEDPQSEALAQRCFQWMLGRNPFSRSQVWGIGYRYREQPHYVATHDEMPGGVPCKGIDGHLDGDPVYHDEPFSDPLPRCVINEVCIAQARYFLAAGHELAFAPRLSGTVRGKGRPREIVARLADSDLVVSRAPVEENGAYRLVFPGSGSYVIQCGPVSRRRFVASATDQCRFDLDLDREIAVSIQPPEKVQAGTPLELRVEVRRLGGNRDRGPHELALRLHNLSCDQPRQSVDLAGKDAVTVSFRLVPQRSAEPCLSVVVPDGQLDKRAECIF